MNFKNLCRKIIIRHIKLIRGLWTKLSFLSCFMNSNLTANLISGNSLVTDLIVKRKEQTDDKKKKWFNRKRFTRNTGFLVGSLSNEHITYIRRRANISIYAMVNKEIQCYIYIQHTYFLCGTLIKLPPFCQSTGAILFC